MKLATLALATLATVATVAETVKTASQPWVTNQIALAVAALPEPDYSTNNTALVDTIETVAPVPGDYATVSNLAVNAVQEETDPVWLAERYSKADNIIFMQDAARSWTCTRDDGTEVVMEWRGIIDNPNEVGFRWECATNSSWHLKYTVCNIYTNAASMVVADGCCWVFGWPHRVKAGGRGDQLLFYPIDSNSMQFDYYGTTYTLTRPSLTSYNTDFVALRYAYIHDLAPYATTNYADSAAASASIAATGALHRVASTGSYTDLSNTPDLGQYSTTGAVAQVSSSLAIHLSATNNPHHVTAEQIGALTAETDPTVPAWAKASSKPSYSYSEIFDIPDLSGYATTDALDNYLQLSGGVVTGSVFVAQQPGDTNAILAAVGEQTYGRFSQPAIGNYPDRSIDYEDERTIAALLKEGDMPLLRLEKIEHGRTWMYDYIWIHDTNHVSIAYEKAELDMDGLGHVRIDTNGVIQACDIRWPTPPEGTNYISGTMALMEYLPEPDIPTSWPYTAITNAPWLTSYTETDPTVPSWAKASSKPSYTYSEISGTPDLGQYSTTGAVAQVARDLSAVSNVAASAVQTETDPTVPSWAKASSKPSYTYSEISNTPDLGGYATTAALDAGTNTVAGLGARIFYGTCATGASTAAKVVTCAGFKTTDLKAGTVLWVKFTNAQTYNGAPTINVNSTGAVNVKRVGTTNAARYEWVAGELICFVHDGSFWTMTDGGLATTSYYGATKLSTTATSTGTTLALTPASLNSFSQGMIAPYPVYAKTGIYEPGDRVRYAYNSYVCKASVVSQDWSEASWQMIDPIQTQLDDLKPSGPIATNSIVRATSGDACRVSLASGATLSAALDVEGVPVMGIVEPAGAYSVSPSIHLLGYGTWPTNSFQAVFWKVGQTTFANVLSDL